jgi:hypothetical protein
MTRDPRRLDEFEWTKISGPGTLTFVSYDEERTKQPHPFYVLQFDDEANGLANDHTPLSKNTCAARVVASAPGSYRIGLKVKDKQGAWSTVSETDLHVVSSSTRRSRPTPTLCCSMAISISMVGAARAAARSDGTKTPKTRRRSRSPKKTAERRSSSPSPSPDHISFICKWATPIPAPWLCAWAPMTSPYQELDDQDRFWKKDAVIYTIFIRRFFDKDGDGQGDLKGLKEKLPYLRKLGVNVLWLMPITPGPTSHGYAATSLFTTHPDYGTLEDWDDMVAEAHRLGMKIMLDTVANHTSDQHPALFGDQRQPIVAATRLVRVQRRQYPAAVRICLRVFDAAVGQLQQSRSPPALHRLHRFLARSRRRCLSL